jgi:simple sugar transport system permease protein
MTTEPITLERPARRLPALPGLDALRTPLGIGVAAGISALIFALILLADGHNPWTAFRLIWEGSVGSTYGRSEILVKLIPFALCAVATAIPARVGLINVGGEGQFYIGAWAATWTILYSGAPAPLLLPAALVAGMAGGAVWAGIAGLLRVRANLNEALSTLLLNYIAVLFVNYFVYGPWRDKSNFNWPYSAMFPEDATLPIVFGTRVSAAILIVPLVLVAMFLLLRYTRIGFNMRAVGGNALAAQRAGIPVGRYLFWSLVAGGAIAGLAGMAEVCGVQGRLRPGISVQYGFIGFLASWLGGHRPLGILFSSLLFGAIAVGGDTLQIGANLPGSTVNILMALILFAVLAGRKGRVAAGA